jgi:hypothetical protein
MTLTDLANWLAKWFTHEDAEIQEGRGQGATP